MKKIKISYDRQKFHSKPSGVDARHLNNSIARSAKEIELDKMKKIAYSIGQEGCAFSPATFRGTKRCKANFEQQLIALDFDNKDPDKEISFEEVRKRAELYDLPVFFAYDTLSSRDHDKFRVVFLNDASITDSRVAEAVQMAVGEMFPESDSSCYKDVSRLYFGGKELIYYDDDVPETNIESIFRNLTCYMKERYKSNHYKERIARFAKETGIALNANGQLDVQVTDYLPGTDNPTEESGAKKSFKNGKNSPSGIIYNNSYIIPNGEIFPNRYYVVNFGTSSSSVKIADKKDKNHKQYRSAILQNMFRKCRLFNDFATGDRKLSHDELLGIATNLINVETGTKYFMEIRSRYPVLYAGEKNERWKDHLSYIQQNDYKPEQCDKYCRYREECRHGRNILATAYTGRGLMEPVAGYHEEFCSVDEMQNDVYDAICDAFLADDKKFYVIKAQTGAGKSHSYLKLMKENDEKRFLIAAPTNLLKMEIYEKAKRLDIEIMATPSLDEIKDEIPDSIWSLIQKLYKRGRYRLVHKYIQKELEKRTFRVCVNI